MTRFLDAIGVGQWRQPVRTLHAQDVIDRPDLDAIYFRFGSGVVAKYKRSTFPAAGPLSFPYPNQTQALAMRAGRVESILPPDAIFNVDLAPWQRQNIDVDEIVNGFDVDGHGNVYIAATIFHWGILDPQMRSITQNLVDTPSRIVALRGASKDYAAMNGARGGVIYDVTDKAHPVKLTASVPNILSWDKTSDCGAVAIIDNRFTALRIWTADGLAAGAAPLFSAPGYSMVTSDGTNFFALRGNQIDVIIPAVNDYGVYSSVHIDPALGQISRIHYGSGYLVVTGVDTAWTWRVYAVSPEFAFSPVPIDLSASITPEGVNSVDGVVVGNHLILCGKTVGDVYELAAVTPPVIVPPVTPDTPDLSKVQEATVSFKSFTDALAAQALYDYVKVRATTSYMAHKDDGTIVVFWF